jgi:hypothetical protein
MALYKKTKSPFRFIFIPVTAETLDGAPTQYERASTNP